MTYNFTDDPNPVLKTFIDAAGGVDLVDGSPQGDLITSAFGGSSVTISISPPEGWSLQSVTWTPGNGTYPIPDPGDENSYSFDYVVNQGAQTKSNGGVFRIKKPSN